MLSPTLFEVEFCSTDTSVRQTLNSNPTNLANLLLTLSHHLFTLLPSDLFPSSSNSTASSQQDTTKEALNCLRVLGRLIVVVYEAEAEARGRNMDMEQTFGAKWLWRRMKFDEVRRQGKEMGDEDDMQELETPAEDPARPDDGAQDEHEEGQFTIADESDDEGESEGATADEGARAFKAVAGNPPSSTPGQSKTDSSSKEEVVDDPLSRPAPEGDDTEEQEKEDDTLPCLIDRLFMCTIDLLFCAGFTVPENVKGANGLGDKVNVRHVLSKHTNYS